MCFASEALAETPERPSVVLENSLVRLVVDLNGGAVGEFRFRESSVNPLHWATPPAGDVSVRGFGHFLCLDRWGPASDSEAAQGMPYHGEASHARWTRIETPESSTDFVQAKMAATLPKAGLAVVRTMRLSTQSSLAWISESVTNQNALGRLYNMVQHPTVGPPFLTTSTRVDCNGRQGFAQGGSLPNPENPSSFWPQAWTVDGDRVNLRRLDSDPLPNVVSFAIDDSVGWITAVTPEEGLLIGYFWRTTDYPWVSVWRDVQKGKPSARGLEFGTTGLHQPFSVLVKKGTIWNRPLFDYLDAGESKTRSYGLFLLKVPRDFLGVSSVQIKNGTVIVRERRETGGDSREFQLKATGLSMGEF